MNDLCVDLCEQYGIQMTKQGLDQRFESPAALFFSTVLESILNELFSSNDYQLPCELFSAFKIKDSTCFQLPEEYKVTYPGSGGSGSEAAIRIQFEYDMLSGKITDLSLHAFNDQDQKNARETWQNLNERELIARDLGYTMIDMIKAISDQKAFFISKLAPVVKNIYLLKQGKYKKVDFKNTLRKMRKYKFNKVEYQAYVGEDKQPIRLLLEKVPDNVYQQRLKQAEAQAKKKGRKVSQERKIRLWLTIFITNISKEELTHEAIQQIYRLRWQIELVFKTWKSYAKLAEIKPMKQIRFECMLYSRLIWLTIQCKLLMNVLLFFMKQTQVQLSMMKLSKLLTRRVKEIWNHSAMGYRHINIYLEKLIVVIQVYCKFEKKKGTESSWEIMEKYLINYCLPVG